MRTIVVLLILSLASGTTAAQSGLDTSSLQHFWQVYEILHDDREPSDSIWNALWATPGYALLETRERRRTALTQAMRLAFRPSLRSEKEAALREENWLARAVAHMSRIPEHRDTLSRFVASLDRGAMDRGAALAQRYLPPETVSRAPIPNMSLVYFLDARGYQERLLIDPLYFLELPNPIEVMAHEFHHYYRATLPPSHRNYGNDLLAWVLSTVETEGIPGLLDKAVVPELSPDSIRRRYKRPMYQEYFLTYQIEHNERSNHRLRQTERVLETIGAHPDSAAVLGPWLHRELPDNGRILGAFMASAIEQRRGRDALNRTVGDPPAFWRLYGEVAAQDTTLPRGLSARALRTLAVLDSTYRR